MTTPQQSAIIWPEEYLPGTTDNFMTNEIIVSGLTAAQVWPFLTDLSKWQSYYRNCSSIEHPSSGPILQKGATFKWCTMGFPKMVTTVEEFIQPADGKPGRVAWSVDTGGPKEQAVKVYHAWLVEDLEGGRVRVLTQESQKGEPVKMLAKVKPNRMVLGHQDWIEGLVGKARGEDVDLEDTNLSKAGMESYEIAQ